MITVSPLFIHVTHIHKLITSFTFMGSNVNLWSFETHGYTSTSNQYPTLMTLLRQFYQPITVTIARYLLQSNVNANYVYQPNAEFACISIV